MIRRLSIAASIAISALSLSGCVSDYAYRDGPGDYYYGQPTVDYNYYGAPYGGVGYGSGYYGGAGYGSGYYGGGYYGGGYGYPYGYGGNTYIYPRYYYRDGDGHGRPKEDGVRTPYYNRRAHGSEKIPGILERSTQRTGPDTRRPLRITPDSRGDMQSITSPPPQRIGSATDGMRSREAIQGRQQRNVTMPQMRAPQQLRSAPIQRAAPPAQASRDSGRLRGRISEP